MMDWKFLVDLRTEVDALTDPVERISRVTERAMQRIGAERSFVALGNRERIRSERDPLLGWRVPWSHRPNVVDAHERRLVASWIASGDYVNDPCPRNGALGAGKLRLRGFDELTRAERRRSSTIAIAHELGMEHRLVAACPLDARTEVHFGFDRARGAPPRHSR